MKLDLKGTSLDSSRFWFLQNGNHTLIVFNKEIHPVQILQHVPNPKIRDAVRITNSFSATPECVEVIFKEKHA